MICAKLSGMHELLVFGIKQARACVFAYREFETVEG